MYPDQDTHSWASKINKHEQSPGGERIMPDVFETEIVKFRWERWDYKAGQFSSLKSVGIPCRYGVYVIRGPSPLSTVRGSSNVFTLVNQVVARAAVDRNRAWERRTWPAIQYQRPRQNREINDRSVVPSQRFSVECAFDDHNDPKLVERRLLKAYLGGALRIATGESQWHWPGERIVSSHSSPTCKWRRLIEFVIFQVITLVSAVLLLIAGATILTSVVANFSTLYRAEPATPAGELGRLDN